MTNEELAVLIDGFLAADCALNIDMGDGEPTFQCCGAVCGHFNCNVGDAFALLQSKGMIAYVGGEWLPTGEELDPDALDAMYSWDELQAYAKASVREKLLSLADEIEAGWSTRDTNAGSTYCSQCGAPQRKKWKHDPSCEVAIIRDRAKRHETHR